MISSTSSFIYVRPTTQLKEDNVRTSILIVKVEIKLVIILSYIDSRSLYWAKTCILFLWATKFTIKIVTLYRVSTGILYCSFTIEDKKFGVKILKPYFTMKIVSQLEINKNPIQGVLISWLIYLSRNMQTILKLTKTDKEC